MTERPFSEWIACGVSGGATSQRVADRLELDASAGLGRRASSRTALPLLLSLLLIGCAAGTVDSPASSSAAGAEVASPVFRSFDHGLPRSGQWRNGFAIADMNGDGWPDLVHGPARKGHRLPSIFLGDGRGSWKLWTDATFPPLPYDYGDVAVADFDGDGSPDLALAAHLRGVVVLLHDGEGAFSLLPGGPQLQPPGEGFSSRALTVVDWNGDGRPDLAALSDGPQPFRGGDQADLGVRIFLNDEPAWRVIGSEGEDRVFGDHIDAGDANGDGRADVLIASNSVGNRDLLRLGAEQGWLVGEVSGLPERVWVPAVALSDLDEDGTDELILGSQDLALEERPGRLDVVVFAERGVRSVEVARLREGEMPTAVAAGDVDGDGVKDLVVGTDDGRVSVYAGHPGLRFSGATELEAGDLRGCRVYGLVVADVDGEPGREIVASFAGEPSAFAGEVRCASGGGLAIWTLRSGERRVVE